MTIEEQRIEVLNFAVRVPFLVRNLFPPCPSQFVQYVFILRNRTEAGLVIEVFNDQCSQLFI